MTSLWRHLWPNDDTLDFEILQCVKMLGERVLQVWRWHLHRFRRYRKKTRGGLEIAPPPPVGRGLTRAWPEGAFDAPRSRIFAIAQKRTALSTCYLAGLLIQQFNIVREFFLKSVGIFFKYGRFCDVTTRHFWSKIGPNFAGLWKTQFLMKTQIENTKRRKMRSSTRWPSRFFKILWFWPLKLKKNDFFGKWSLKSKIFNIFKKP